MRHLYLLGSLGLALGAAGCVATGLVNERTQSSVAAIRAAEEVGVSKAPEASVHLALAKETLARARALSADGKKQRAASLLMRAEVDAELALVLSREQSQRTDAEQSIERARVLRQENQ